MSTAQMQALQQQATDLAARVAALELGGGSAGLSAAQVQNLEELRQLLVAAKEEQDSLRKERDQALKEVSKLNYRILHLTRNLRAADGGAAAAAAPTKA